MNHVIYQWQLFLLAISFFTRIPVPSNLPYSSLRMNQSGRYFPLVGVLLALICGGCFNVLGLILPTDISLFITMVLSLLLTGAFHEDGLADMADGIGGGMTAEKRLTIMKDSRIGTYGSSALIMALLGKFILLKWIIDHAQMEIMWVWILGYTLSRAVACSLIFDTPYVSDLNTSKSKPLANQQNVHELVIVILTGLLPCLFFPYGVSMGLLLTMVITRWSFKHWLTRRLGGFTGDCLGALQQICELLIYLILIIFVFNY